MKKLLLLLLFSISPTVFAVDPGLFPETIVNCVKPTQRADGSPLAPDEIALIRFYWGTATGDYQNIVEKTDCQWIIDNTVFPGGTTIFFTETAVDTQGRESEYDVESTHVIDVPVTGPKSPNGVTLTHVPASQ